MRLVTFESLTLTERPHARGGVFRNYDLLMGREGSPSNYYLSIGVLSGDFVSPRHRHNFDQVRFQLEGSYDFAADGRMDPKTIGYFPEGTRYGPQKALSENSQTLVLQFGGASGNGYMSEPQFQRGLADMQGKGTFANGVFTRIKPDGGKINQDAYEAVWEHVNGRDLEYPKERYNHSVFMHPDNFAWMPVAPGRAVKQLGTFTERGAQIAFHRLEAGARLPLEAGSIYFVWDGAGEVSGRAWRKWSTVEIESGERIEMRASETAEILQMGLNRFDQEVAQREAA